MYESCTEIGDVRYNPATGAFESLVTVPTRDGDLRVAAQFEAPLDTPDDVAAAGLKSQAIASLNGPNRLASRRRPRAAERAAEARKRPATVTRIFGALFGNHAA